MRATTRFKQLIQGPDILRMPCVPDSLSAVIAQRTGFEAVCIGGYGASASLLGKPDIGLMTMTEMAEHTARMCDAVDIPVFVDADTGHGDTVNVRRTVRALEKAGAAGLFLEDQVFPKRCGHMAGKDIVSRQEMLAKLHAALDARHDEDFVIMGRTDALAVAGIDEALERGRLMKEAGADMIFVETPLDMDHLAAIPKAFEGPHFTVYLEGGRIPTLPADEFERLGYTVLAYGTSALYAAAYAIQEVLADILETGETRNSQDRMFDFTRFNELMGLEDIRKRQQRDEEAGGS